MSEFANLCVRGFLVGTEVHPNLLLHSRDCKRLGDVRTEGGNTLPEALRRMRDLAKDWTIDSWADQLRQPRVSVALNKNVYNVNKKK
ncbi:Gag protein, partial [Danaus plexippus plexippus]